MSLTILRSLGVVIDCWHNQRQTILRCIELAGSSAQPQFDALLPVLAASPAGEQALAKAPNGLYEPVFNEPVFMSRSLHLSALLAIKRALGHCK